MTTYERFISCETSTNCVRQSSDLVRHGRHTTGSCVGVVTLWPWPWDAGAPCCLQCQYYCHMGRCLEAWRPAPHVSGPQDLLAEGAEARGSVDGDGKRGVEAGVLQQLLQRWPPLWFLHRQGMTVHITFTLVRAMSVVCCVMCCGSHRGPAFEDLFLRMHSKDSVRAPSGECCM